jgi:hypothetical protein
MKSTVVLLPSKNKKILTATHLLPAVDKISIEEVVVTGGVRETEVTEDQEANGNLLAIKDKE